MNFNINCRLLGRWGAFFLILLATYSVGWVTRQFGSVSLDEVLVFFQDGIGGVDAGLVCDFVKHVV